MCWNWICMCVHAKIEWFCWTQRTNWVFAANCVIGNESVSLPNCVVSSESAFAVELCCLQRMSFRCWIYVVRSESGVRCRMCVVRNKSGVRCWICVVRTESGFCYWIFVVRSESGFCCRIVLSTANQVFAVELCIPQWIRCSLSNCVFCKESGVRCRICVVRSELSFCCWILSSAANQVSLPNLCCPQQICSLSNSVVRSESGVRCRIMLSTVNQVFAAEFVLSAAS